MRTRTLRRWLLCLLLGARLLAEQAVSISSTGHKWDAGGNFLACFEVKNVSAETFSFSGYSDDDPIYTIELRKYRIWRPERTGWCGVGMRKHEFPPGKTIVLDMLPPKGKQPWRLALPLQSAASDGKTEQTVFYSKPVLSPKSVPAASNQAPSHLGEVELGVAYHDGLKYPCEFTLTNRSSSVLYYGGFKEKDVPPIYLGQEYIGKKWTEEGSVNWSGTGLGFQTLAPSESITFSIPAQSLEHPWRVGIHLFRTDKPGALHDAYAPVWWPQLPKRGVTPNPIPGSITVSLIEASTPPPQ